ncbi:MAG: hypothetical protein HONBIEJF_02540 [Fimbriimonadaceae bacterium]|nr:hypothetical protein [Fimbriimonadaceae bacterium]
MPESAISEDEIRQWFVGLEQLDEIAYDDCFYRARKLGPENRIHYNLFRSVILDPDSYEHARFLAYVCIEAVFGKASAEAAQARVDMQPYIPWYLRPFFKVGKRS